MGFLSNILTGFIVVKLLPMIPGILNVLSLLEVTYTISSLDLKV